MDLPHTETIWLWRNWGKPRLGRIGRTGGGGCIDPFDSRFSEWLEEDQKDWVTKNSENPWIIGYIFENENTWNYDTFNQLLARGSDCAAKGAFVDFLRRRYNNSLHKVNAVLGTQAKSFDALASGW